MKLLSVIAIFYHKTFDTSLSTILTHRVYNVQPGFRIDYNTGQSWPDDSVTLIEEESDVSFIELNEGLDASIIDRTILDVDTSESTVAYILNIKSMKFHFPYCSSVTDMKDKNRKEFYGTREALIEMGYKPCGACNP